jgi:hypothetical protein
MKTKKYRGCQKKYTHTGQVYLNMLRTSILPEIRTLFGNDRFNFQQDGAPPHFHRDVRSYLDENLPGQWIGRRGAVEFPPHSPDLTPFDFCLWGPYRMWRTAESWLHWRYFAQKLKRHAQRYTWTLWSALLKQ